MASTRASTEKHQPSASAAASGILALLVEARNARVKDDKNAVKTEVLLRKNAVKTEVLLRKAGLSLEDIAAVTGKTHDAVRVSLQRSKVK